MQYFNKQNPEGGYKRKVITLLMCFLVLSAIVYHGFYKESISVITWDVFGYYVYLPALFEYGDLKDFAFVGDLHMKYQFSNEIYQVNADRMPIYTLGLAILYLPFFLIAHLFASLIPGYDADGLSAPYQTMIIAGSLFWVGLGLNSLWHWLSAFFEKNVVAICLIILVLGTNLYCYSVVESGMPHAFLFGLYSVLLLATHRWYETGTLKWILITASCMALLCLSRPSEIVCFLIPLFYPMAANSQYASKLRMFQAKYKQIILAILVFMVWMLPQIGFWLWRTGQFVYNAYAEAGHQFDFDSPHIFDGLFSYRKGWLVYTPLMVLSLLGIALMWLKKDTHKWVISLFFLLNLYFVLSWHMWWYAGSFGMRALIQSYAILAFPLGFLLNKSFKNTLTKFAIIIIIVVGILFNLFQTWQYTNRILPFDEVTKTFYWKTFLKTTYDSTLRLYLDSDESAPSNMKFSKVIDSIGAAGEAIRDTIIEGRLCQIVKSEAPYSMTIKYSPGKEELKSLAGSWVRVEATGAYSGTAFTEYDAAVLVLNLQKSDGSHVKWVGVRFPRFVTENRLENFGFDFSLPEDMEDGYQLLAYIHNGSPDTIFVSNISILAPE